MRFKISAALLLLLSVCALPFAHATNLIVKCGAPTTNTDGTPISSSATIGYNVYGGMQGSALQLLTPTPLTTCLRTATNVTPGTVCYAVSAVETLNGVVSESAQSTPICTTVSAPAPIPNTPTGVTVTVSVPTAANTIYVIEKSTDRLVLLPAGTVPAGTVCDPMQSIVQNGSVFNVVPSASVTWTGSVKSIAAFAKCS